MQGTRNYAKSLTSIYNIDWKEKKRKLWYSILQTGSNSVNNRKSEVAEQLFFLSSSIMEKMTRCTDINVFTMKALQI